MRVIAVKTGVDDGPPSAEVTGTPLEALTIAPDHDTIAPRMEDLVFTLTRTGDVTGALTVTVNLTQDQTWLSTLSHEVTFSAGSATATLRLRDFHFARGHAAGDLEAAVAAVTGYGTGTATVRVLTGVGNVFHLQLTEAPAFMEGQTPQATVTARLTAPETKLARARAVPFLVATQGAPVTEGYTAINGTDYKDYAGTVTVAASAFALADGTWTAEMALPLPSGFIIDDSTVEGTETFAFQLAGAPQFNWLSFGPEAVQFLYAYPAILRDNDKGLVLSPSALTVVEGDTAGAAYTVKLATAPTAAVTVTVTGHAGTDVTVDETSLSFTTTTWDTAQTVTVTAAEDNDTADETVTLTHTAAGGGYAGETRTLAVTVDDDDELAQVTGVTVTAQAQALKVDWTAVTDATGYKVQWKSGVETFADAATDARERTVTGGATVTDTIPSLTAGTEYTVRVIAVKTGVDDGPPSAEVTGTPLEALTIAPDHDTIAPRMEDLVFTLTRTGDVTGALTVTVNLTQDQTWLSTLSHEVTFSAGSATATLRLRDFHFARGHAAGDLEAAVAAVTGYGTGTATVRVLTGVGNVFHLQLTEAPAFMEGQTPQATVTARLTAPETKLARARAVPFLVATQGAPVTEGYTAINGTDYKDYAGTVTVAASAFALADGTWTAEMALPLPSGFIIDDSTVEGTETFAFQLAGAPQFNWLSFGPEAVQFLYAYPAILRDNDKGLVLSPSALTVVEGDTAGAAYTVKLATAPTAAVTVTVTGHAGTDVTVDETSLSFTTTTWDTAQDGDGDGGGGQRHGGRDGDADAHGGGGRLRWGNADAGGDGGRRRRARAGHRGHGDGAGPGSEGGLDRGDWTPRATRCSGSRAWRPLPTRRPTPASARSRAGPR